jgi:hypothetical protein
VTRPALRDYLVPAVADVVADAVDLVLLLGRTKGAPPAVAARAEALGIKLAALGRGFYAHTGTDTGTDTEAQS